MGMIIQLSLVTFPKVLTQVNNKNLDINNAMASQSFVLEIDVDVEYHRVGYF